MSNTKKKKKSTKKFKKLDTSKLIPIIAIVEVFILIAVSSYAWYFFSADKTLSSGIITVNADSGLEIDFKDADKSTYIDIFDYVDRDNFAFEPATSVDGRNIFFPTTGTFGSTDTSSMIFREGTVNDINSKYLNIDFELTNTTSRTMEVYLSSRSSFTISKDSDRVNGKALRLAFYNNDGNTGNVTSNIVSNIKKAASTESSTEPTVAPTVAPSEGATESPYHYETWTVYFNDLSNRTNWGNVKAFVWHEGGSNTHVEKWPGDSMVKVSGTLYSYSFQQRYELDGSGNKINYFYDHIIFNNGSSGDSNQTVDIPLTAAKNGRLFYATGIDSSSSKHNCTDTAFTMNTVYFLKPTDWTVTPRCATGTAAVGDSPTTYEMTKVTTGIYSYSFPSTDTHVRFFGGSEQKSNDTPVTNQKLYYFPGGGVAGSLSYVDYNTASIYFYNTLGWKQPYAFVNAFANSLGSYTYAIPMIALSGDLYYCSLSTAFLKDKVQASAASSFADNCMVYFADSDSATAANYANRSYYADCYSEHVYRLLTTKSTDTTVPGAAYTRYELDDESYSDEVDITADSYAVISPGVSAGFQRAANPVNKINTATGAVESVIPAFASSFDDFILGSNNPVFKIRSGETVSMSMIIWLEGTDSHCTGENYAGRNINLYLEFSTFYAGDKVEGTYTYQFIDETEQHWTADTITNSVTGITVSPVMQLYDATLDRGYLMEGVTPVTYAGQKKVRIWECVAPQALVTQADGYSHKLEFRRVNPYDETEVWNRWEAGDPHTYSADALFNGVVSFTAFADGSPDPTLYASYISDYNMPAASCGGLWGIYDTEILTVYDGRKDRSMGTLNFGYTYTYPNSGQSVTIEYKASGYRNLTHDTKVGFTYTDGGAGSMHTSTGSWFDHFYSIVIPSTIYDNASNSYFRNYTGVDGTYAINSNLNTNIKVGNTWWAGAVKGSFFEFNEEGSNVPDSNNHKSQGSNYHSYWGSDVLYIQAASTLSVSYSSITDQCFMQVKFYDSSNENGKKFFSYLYEDNNYAGSYGYGFVAVVPCNQTYNSYKVERLRASNHNESTGLTRLSTHTSTITGTTDSERIYNILNPQTDSDRGNDSTDGRIRTLNYDYKIIYFQGSNWGSEWSHPKLYSDLDTWIHDGNGTGKYTTGNNKQYYSYHIRSDWKAKFYWEYASEHWSVDITPADGYCYYPKEYNVNNSGKTDVGGYNHNDLDSNQLYGNSDSNTSPNTAIHTGVFSVEYISGQSGSWNTGWPEHVAPDSRA